MNISAIASIEAAVRGLGSHFDADVLAATHAIYRPHIRASDDAAPADVAYGPHERHRLDVYLPQGSARAIVVYVHGGGFVRGEKNLDGVFYRNVGRFLTDEGFAAVIPNYRRAPEFGWPCGAQDVQGMLQWVYRNAQHFGTKVPPVFVMGQSAGASHVASWFFDDAARGGPLPKIAGVLLMSGFYKARAPLAENIAAYFGDDETVHDQRSPLTHVKPVHTPLWLSVAELDPGRIASQTFELAQAVTVHNGRSPDFAWLRGHNHVSTILSLGSPQRDAGEEILRFLRAHT